MTSKRLQKKDVETIIALSPMQEGLLFHYRSQPNSEQYFEQLTLSLTGDVRSEAIRAAWNGVIQANEMLRTVYRWENLDKPVQVILKQLDVPFREIDLSHIPAKEREVQLEALLHQDRAERIDLMVEPFRVTLCRFGDSDYEMIISNHHILYDGWSNGTILKEFVTAYSDVVEGRTPSITSKTSYKEFIKWGQGRNRESQRQFWSDHLAGFEEKSTLPTLTNSSTQSEKPGTHVFAFSEAETEQIKSFARVHGLTLATLLYGSWGVLLQRYCCTQDVVFGTTVSGRTPEVQGISDLVGLFINTIPLRLTSPEDASPLQVFREVDRLLKVREEHEETPLVEIKAVSEIDGLENLFDSILVIENYPLDVQVKQGDGPLQIKGYRMFELTSFPLTLSVQTYGELELHFLYHGKLFDAAIVERMSHHYRNLLLQMVEQPDGVVSKFDLLNAEEKEQIHAWNETSAPTPTELVTVQFEQLAEQMPHQVAAIFGKQMLTYQELNEKANRLARTLRKKGVGPEQIVALLFERSLEMMVGIMAVLKAGGAYLPIDPTFPADRIDFILKNSEPRLLLTQTALRDLVAFEGETIDLLDEQCYDEDGTNLPLIQGLRNLAYVIYTSGSTGNPKGVMIEHQSLINRIHWMHQRYPMGRGSVVLQKTPYTFDVSVWELILWATSGASICFLAPGGEKDPEMIIEAIEQHGITDIHFVPSMLSVFLEALEVEEAYQRVRSLRHVFASGEALSVHHADRFRQLFHETHDVTLHNLYGPTEATIDVSYFDCMTETYSKSIPIGRPISNTQLYVFDRNMQLLPVGVVGELYIAGVNVARGYLNRPELTEEKFVENPFKPGEKLYRTGDLARWMPDGNIEYMGRVDHQIKIRGLRIELGEIESHLVRHQAVKDAIVLVKHDTANQPYLCGYYVAEQELTVEDLRDHLSRAVPSYMIPTRFVWNTSFPVTANGKLDRKRLPEPEEQASLAEYVAPENEVEKNLAAIWSRLLIREMVGIHDNFFDIGGNSFLLMQMQSQIQRLYPDKVRVTDLFTYVTIHKLALFIENGGSSAQQRTLTPVSLPEDFFQTNASLQSSSALTGELSADTLELLRSIATHEHVDLYDVLLAIYAYLFTEVTEQKQLTVQAATLQWQTAAQVEVDLERVQGFSGLFASVNAMRKEEASDRMYQLEGVDHSSKGSVDGAVLPFFYARKSVDSSMSLLEMFDIVLEMHEEYGRCVLTCEYDSQRLKKEKVMELFENYLELLTMLADTYQPETSR